MIKVAFCGDDTSALRELNKLTGKYSARNGRAIGTDIFHRSLDLLSAIEKGVHYDILFLDVTLTNENKIHIAKEIRQYDSVVKIIFLTSSTECAVQSYTFDAYFYQHDPIWTGNFFKLMDSAIAECQEEQNSSLILRGKSGITRIDLNRLRYCEVFRRTLLFHMADGNVWENAGSMDDLHKQLSQYDNFMRPHRSFLINMEYIQKISYKTVTMEDLTEIPIPHGKCSDIKNRYLEYMFRSERNGTAVCIP